MNITIESNTEDFFLVHLSSSTKVEIPTSIIETAEVMAAMKRRRKKKKPRILPKGRRVNAAGIDMKLNLDPAAGFNPNVKTIGNINKPPIKAISVSAIAISKDSLKMLSLSLK